MSVIDRTEVRYILPQAVPSAMLSATGRRRGVRRRHRTAQAATDGARARARGGSARGGRAGSGRGRRLAHCRCSGAPRSSRASRSTRSPTCGAAGSCSRSARALLRDKKKAGSAVPALLRLAALLPATRALAACSTWQRRTFAHTQGLEGRFVAHGHLARLHDESQARVDALNSRLLLLQSTGEHRHTEATAVAGGHWAAHKRCEQVDRVAGGAGGARTLVGAGSYGRGAHLALARVAHRCSRDCTSRLVKGVITHQQSNAAGK